MKRAQLLLVGLLLVGCDAVDEKYNDLCCVRMIESCDTTMICAASDQQGMCLTWMPLQTCYNVCTEYAALERGHGRMCNLVLRKGAPHGR